MLRDILILTGIIRRPKAMQAADQATVLPPPNLTGDEAAGKVTADENADPKILVYLNNEQKQKDLDHASPPTSLQADLKQEAARCRELEGEVTGLRQEIKEREKAQRRLGEQLLSMSREKTAQEEKYKEKARHASRLLQSEVQRLKEENQHLQDVATVLRDIADEKAEALFRAKGECRQLRLANKQLSTAMQQKEAGTRAPSPSSKMRCSQSFSPTLGKDADLKKWNDRLASWESRLAQSTRDLAAREANLERLADGILDQRKLQDLKRQVKALEERMSALRGKTEHLEAEISRKTDELLNTEKAVRSAHSELRDVENVFLLVRDILTAYSMKSTNWMTKLFCPLTTSLHTRASRPTPESQLNALEQH